ncbi:MAG: amidohydrolase family protein [Bdellovibrionales bacterium]|nr:amidohydrolase family protein [Bdellovibrionales bacterium]
MIISGGAVVDGSGAPARKADVGIDGDSIVAIGDLSAANGKERIDAEGLTVAPGFIDVHNHSDWWLYRFGNFTEKTLQGFTTEILCSDGFSYAPLDEFTAPEWIAYQSPINGLAAHEYKGWRTLADYGAMLDRRTAQNFALQVPYGNVRSMAMGFGAQAPDDFQMHDIRTLIRRGMAEGATGLSTGLDYAGECFAETAELIAACEAIREASGLYVTHIRYKLGTLEGVQEAVTIAERAGVALHVSHLKSRNAEEADTLLGYIDTVAVERVDFSFDVYPYYPPSTMLSYLLPYEVWVDGPLAAAEKLQDRRMRARFARYLDGYDLEAVLISWLPSEKNRSWIGKSLAAYVQATEKPVADALCDLLFDEQLSVLLVFHRGEDRLVHPFLTHSKFMLGTDGVFMPGAAHHPRTFGSAARILGPCVRDHKLFSLEEAVRRMTSIPAERFGLTNRGRLREGAFADLAIFDADRIQDRATYTAWGEPSVGMQHVIVNGEVIVRNGREATGAREELPGRYLRYRE